jgi:hypothetical protein
MWSFLSRSVRRSGGAIKDVAWCYDLSLLMSGEVSGWTGLDSGGLVKIKCRRIVMLMLRSRVFGELGCWLFRGRKL